jgi:error-prone DNA polymerase
VTSAEDALVLPETTTPEFRALGEDEAIGWDYASSSHSVRGHPMLRYRALLSRRGIPTAHEVARLHDGALVDYVAFVICRQRPGTASGVTFFTLEDETGFVNLVVWTQIFEKYELLAKTADLMGVSGRIQSQHGVVHVVADRLYEPDLHARTAPRSRDFH